MEPTETTSNKESGTDRPTHRLNLDEAIIPSRGKPFDLTNQDIYDLIEFP